MKKRLLAAAAAVLCLSAASGRTSAADARPAAVVISVDGLAHFYFDDPKAEMPTIRRLAAEGARADGGMKAVIPTVTWPNHTSLVTGVRPARHGVFGNTMFDRASGKSLKLIWDPDFDKEQIVKSPTIYDVAKGAGLSTAAVTWPASRGAKTLDWAVPDVGTDALVQQYSTPAVIADCKAAGVPIDQLGPMFKAGDFVARDRIGTQVFNLILEKHRPALALFHLLNVDHVEHYEGPSVDKTYDAIKEADAQVGNVLAAADKAYGQGKYAVFIVSDHGFFAVSRQVMPYVVLRKAGLVEVKGVKMTGGQVKIMSQGGSCFVYVTEQDATKRKEIVEKLPGLFADVEGISGVIRVKDFGKYGLADPAKDPNGPDAVLTAKEGFQFGDTVIGDVATTTADPKKPRKGTHGFDPNAPAMKATFVARGPGIAAGKKLGAIENVSVAPTVAVTIGLSMPDADGKPLPLGEGK